MDLFSEYGEEEGQQTAPAALPANALKPRLLLSSATGVAPPSHAAASQALALVNSGDAASSHASAALASALRTGVMSDANLPVALMYAPAIGPVDPRGGAKSLAGGASGDTYRTPTAMLAADNMDPVTFAAQYNTYSTHGYAADPSGSGALVGSAARYAAATGQAAPKTSAQRYAAAVPGQKRGRAVNDDPSDAEGYLGPWAGFDGERGMKDSALSKGTLTLKQKLLRLDQGLDPYGPGKLEKEALEAARAKVQAEVEEAKKEEERAAAAAAGAGAGAGAAGGPSASKAAKMGGSAGSAAGGSAAGAAAGALPSSAAASSSFSAAGGHGILTPKECKSTFHGPELFDYQGRSWMATPKGVRADGGDHECFVPKRLGHKWAGHGKGVNSVGFFPGTGHLLLSASLDGKVKVWDVSSSKGLRRTYGGHTGGVRQAVWCSDGTKFTSVSFDKSAKVWDTETGTCLASYSNGSVPLCVAWAPGQEDSVFLTGTQNRKILQYDLRVKAGPGAGGGGGSSSRAGGGAGAGAGSSSSSSAAEPTSDPVLEYDNHLGPVNAISFFDSGRRFMSAGDDRLLVWDYGTPVPIKHIADPAQHAVTAAAVSPDGTSWVGSSMDNTIVSFTLGDRIARNLNKVFRGHIVAGYACQPAFSPDGRFLGSGDGDGSAWFWDWRSHRILNKFKAHDNGPCMGMAWHPLQPAWVATCGWDGVIKLWE